MKTQDFTEPRENSPVRIALALAAALSASVLISGCNKPVDEQAPPATPAETAPPAETPPPAESPPATDPAAPAPTDSTTPPTDPATPPSDPATAPTPTDSDSAPKN